MHKPIEVPGRERDAGWIGNYKSALSTFPTGVCLAVAGGAGAAQAVTISSFVSISLDPPIVQLALKNNSRFLGTLLNTPAFSLYVLAEGQGELAMRYAKQPASAVQEDALLSAAAAIHCVVDETLLKGDHTVIFAAVTAAEHRNLRPLLYFRTQFFNLPQEAS
jgi:flavin reductase (DIM6/NTAB) family NADH-FMN oxidoreductase RutF